MTPGRLAASLFALLIAPSQGTAQSAWLLAEVPRLEERINAGRQTAIDPGEFGAACDASDSSTAINAALKAAAAASRTVLLKCLYTINKTLSVPEAVILMGEERGGIVVGNGLRGEGIIIHSRAGVANLQIVGKGAARAPWSAVAVPSGQKDFFVYGLTIRDSTGPGIAVKSGGASNGIIAKNEIDRTAEGACIDVSNGGGFSRDVLVLSNSVVNCRMGNIVSKGLVDGFYVIQNRVGRNDPDRRGDRLADNVTAYSADNRNIVVAKNDLADSENHGIHVGGDNVQVLNNTVRNAKQNGIYLLSAPGGSISHTYSVIGNVVLGSRVRNGIAAEKISGLHLEGNRVCGAALKPIVVTTSSGVQIGANDFTCSLPQ